MTIPRLNDDYYFHITVIEKTLAPHEVYLKIQEQTRKPDEACVTTTKVADCDGTTMNIDPETLIENAIIELHNKVPQYFKDFEDPEERFTRALTALTYPDPQAKTPEPATYPDFLDPDKMDDTTLTALLIVLKNYCEVLPNSDQNIVPVLGNAQMIAVLIVLERAMNTDRTNAHVDALCDALVTVLNSARRGAYYDLQPHEWIAVEHYYARLAKKAGKEPRNADGELIVLPEDEEQDSK